MNYLCRLFSVRLNPIRVIMDGQKPMVQNLFTVRMSFLSSTFSYQIGETQPKNVFDYFGKPDHYYTEKTEMRFEKNVSQK